MSYSQQEYVQATEALKNGQIPPDKVAIVKQRVSEFEDDQARGYKGGQHPLPAPKEPENPPDAPLPPGIIDVGALQQVSAPLESHLLESKSPQSEAIRATMTPEALEARRQRVDWSKKLTQNPKLNNASKLKVFDNPTEYEPPPSLPGQLGSALPQVTTNYFEPTAEEFRQAALATPQLLDRLREQFPDVEVEKLPRSELENSEAYKVYADAKWQHALGDAMKTKTPIVRVDYSPKTMGVDEQGNRKLKLSGHLAHGLDSARALGTGVAGGLTGGLYDLGLTASAEPLEKTNARRKQVADLTGDQVAPLESSASTSVREFRDTGRGAAERNPGTQTAGQIGGAILPSSLPSKLWSGLGKGLAKVVKPTSLPGRLAAAGAVGATTAVLDENIRSAAKLAADAIDADKSARETALALVHGIHASPTTAIAGGLLGAGADLLGAGAGAWQKAHVQSDRLLIPLAHFEESGGRMGPLMGRKVTPEAEAYKAKAIAQRTTPQDVIVDEIAQPMATQRLLEQEGALRQAETDTSIAHAKLEGETVNPLTVAARVKALSLSKPGATPESAAAKNQLNKFVDRIGHERELTAQALDQYIDEAAEAAKYGRKTSPVEHWDEVGKYLRDLRDELKFRDQETVVTEPEDKGLFTADAEATIAEPLAKPIGGVRDKYGNVKPVTDYSAEKIRQSKLQQFHADMNKRLGLPAELQAESVLSEPVVDKGLFNVKTPQEVVDSIPPKARLNEEEYRTFEGAIRKTSGRDYLKHRREMENLAERTDAAAEMARLNGAKTEDLTIKKKLQIVRLLDDKDQLSQAMGRAIDGLGTSGRIPAGFFEKMGIRMIPTLRSLSGGLPKVAPHIPDGAVARLREFIPTLEAIGLRGGKPVRTLGAMRDEPFQSKVKFDPEEREFWLKVIDQISKENPNANAKPEAKGLPVGQQSQGG